MTSDLFILISKSILVKIWRHRYQCTWRWMTLDFRTWLHWRHNYDVNDDIAFCFGWRTWSKLNLHRKKLAIDERQVTGAFSSVWIFKMLSVMYTDARVEGDCDRLNINPPPPTPLSIGDPVTVMYNKEEYQAVMLNDWRDDTGPIIAKTGKKTKLTVYFPCDGKKGSIARDLIKPSAPSSIDRYQQVEAKYSGRWFNCIMLDAWQPGNKKRQVHSY